MKELRLDYEGTPGTLDMVTHVSIHGHWDKPVVFYRESPAYAALQAENERLRKAGNYLWSTAEVNGISKNGDLEMHERALAFWREAAKGMTP